MKKNLGVVVESFHVIETADLYNYMRRMFNGILSDVIGRDGHVSETGNGNNDNAGGGGACADRWAGDGATPTAGIVERHVTGCHNHAAPRMRSSAVTSSQQSARHRRHGDRESSRAATGAQTPTSVSRSRRIC